MQFMINYCITFYFESDLFLSMSTFSYMKSSYSLVRQIGVSYLNRSHIMLYFAYNLLLYDLCMLHVCDRWPIC